MSLLQMSNSKLLRSLAAAALLLLFPGFFFYHSTLAAGLIPPILGGFFGPIALLFCVVLLPLHVRGAILGNQRSSAIGALFLFTICYLLLWSVIHVALGDEYQSDVDFFLYGLANLMFWVTLYICGYWLTNTPSLRLLFAFALAGMTVIALLGAEGQFYYAARSAETEAAIATYQGFARSALFSALVLICFSRALYSYGVFLVSTCLLFVLGARSEFIGLVIVAVSVFLIRDGIRAAGGVLAVAILLGILGVAFNVLDAGSRMLEIFDIRTSSSYLARNDLTNSAIATIQQHPFLGDYGSQLKLGGIGSFAHNILSAWVSYGIVGFMCFAGLMFEAIRVSVKGFKFRSLRSDDVSLLAFSLVSFCLMQAVFAKPVYYPLYGLAWGLSAQICKRIDRRVSDH